MFSRFFRRRTRNSAHFDAVPPVVPAAPVAPTAPRQTPVTGVPVAALFHAVALRDERAADPAARPAPAHMQLLLAASRQLALCGTEPHSAPSRPSVLPQLLEVVEDEEASLRALSRILYQDPRLTAELLRSANSPFYRAGSAPVESVERAAAVLGTRGIRALLAAELIKPLVRDDGARDHFREVAWERSLYAASAAEAWVASTQDADALAAHLLCLLHGLGSVTVYRVLGDLYAAQPGLAPDAAAIAMALDANAAVTASRIAASWGLSERLCTALEAQSSAAPVASAPSPLAVALRFGLLVGTLVLLCRHGRLGRDEALAQVAANGFTGAAVERIWDRLGRAYISP